MFEQDRVLLRLQQRVVAERQVLVCFLSGSYGRGVQDPYSDLDVALVYADDDSRAGAYERRREFVRSVLPYVPAKSFDATHVRPFLHIAVYSNGSKVDYRFETKDSLAPNPWDREIRLLKDDDGWGKAFQDSSLQLAPSLPLPTTTAKDLASIDDRFWIMFVDVYRQVLRGDHDKPFTVYLQLLHFTLPELMRLLPVEEPARQALISVNYQRDARVTVKHLRQLLRTYLAAREAIIQRHRLVFVPDDAFERELQRKISP
ncbi:MAG TPA: nucleotidyltransferase domain-containing protein [Anaerolineae bacterium]|jgi:predicted nucleotidyltransferase|nr:nucleotidyltransferase domain-containing protein [Anaerolineae bacterium]